MLLLIVPGTACSRTKILTPKEKQNLAVRWYLDVQSKLHVLRNQAEDEYEDMGQILNAAYFQRHSFAGQMDWVFTLVEGEKMPLLEIWKLLPARPTPSSASGQGQKTLGDWVTTF